MILIIVTVCVVTMLIKSIEANSNVVVPYKYLNSQAISMLIQELPSRYPNLVSVGTSQGLYGLSTAGNERDCPFDISEKGCVNWIVHIYDRIKHNISETSQSYQELPTVLLSGALHGDERVGPTTVMEVAILLLEAAQCESYYYTSENQPQKYHGCREELRKKGVQDDRTRRWLARLVTTRRIIIVPSANALGYYRNEREEDGIDPNRDFPYDLLDATQCMQTVAGRTLNEIFRNYLVQLSFTFHGGMEAIGYEWGAPSYLNQGPSPDDIAQVALASRYSWYGGSVDNRKYPYGDMNRYPVRGGMEDWAYAASWDKEHTIPCSPITYDKYPTDRTIYDEGMLRTLNMLVETSDSKEPLEHTLGTNQDLFSPDGEGNGHISRNIRLSLLAIDVVQPYVSLTHVNGINLTDLDAIPLLRKDPNNCRSAIVQMSHSDETATVQWTVGGSFDVDETYIVYGRQEEMVGSGIVYCTSQPDPQRLNGWISSVMNNTKIANVGNIQVSAAQSGRTRWHEQGSKPARSSQQLSYLPIDPEFDASILISSFQPGDSILIFAMATVDSSWNKSNSAAQSHLANTRTNDSWHVTNAAGMAIQGHIRWISTPIVLQLEGQIGESLKHTDEEVEKNILPGMQNITQGFTETRNGATHLLSTIHLALLCLIILASVLIMRWRLYVNGNRRRANVRERAVELETLRLGSDTGYTKKGQVYYEP